MSDPQLFQVVWVRVDFRRRTFSTSALTGATITFNLYQASGTQVAVQQGLDLTIV